MTEGFVKIRRGIREHIKRGKLHPVDLGIYLFLHLECDWATGIYHGTALGIAHGFDDVSLHSCVQKALRRLRDHQFINFRKGDGKRRGYDILMDKYEPTIGKRSGLRLNAWKHGNKVIPEYEAETVGTTVELRCELESSNGRVTVEPPILEVLEEQEVKKALEEQKSKKELLSIPSISPETPSQSFVTENNTMNANDDVLAASKLFCLLDQPVEHKGKASSWELQIRPLMITCSLPRMKAIMSWAFTDTFWIKKLCLARDPMASFVKNWGTIEKQFDANQKVAKKIEAAQAKAQAKVASLSPKAAPGSHGNKSGMEL